MRTIVQQREVPMQTKKRSSLDPRLPAPRTYEERRTTSIFSERRHQSR
jgi:hypothetical protein